MIFVFSTGREAAVVGYISHVLSAYAFTVLVINMPNFSSKVRSFISDSRPSNLVRKIMYSNEYGRKYMTDKSYRAIVALYSALSMTLFYAAFKLIAGIYYASFWYGADALFYIVLSAVQFLMLRHMRRQGESLENEYRQYRFCGVLLFVLNAALSGVVFQIVHQDMGYKYPGLLIYVVATYAFICLAVAIVNVVTYRKLNSPVISAVKAIQLSKALVAMFALQTAMLNSFGSDVTESFALLTNSLTGGGVCLFIFGMALFMILRANKNLKYI